MSNQLPVSVKQERKDARTTAIVMAKASHNFETIKSTLENLFGDNSLNRTAIFEIIRRVKNGADMMDKTGLQGRRR